MTIRIHCLDTKTHYDITDICQAKIALDKMIYLRLLAQPVPDVICCGKTVGEIIKEQPLYETM